MVDFREALGLGSAHLLSLFRPLSTHPSEYNRDTMYLRPPPPSWEMQGRRKEDGGLSVTCTVIWPHSKHSLPFPCPRTAGAREAWLPELLCHDRGASGGMTAKTRLYLSTANHKNCYSSKTLFSTSICY